MRDNYINSDVVGNSINYFKKYSEMNYKEKNLVLNFFLCKNNEINSIEKLDSMFKVKIYDIEKREEVLELEQLTKENSEKYLITFNDSFSDMPHGTWLDNDGLTEFLNSNSDNKYYFMVKEKEKIIGFMNCEIENNEGLFDIGLCKEYRGRGLGKRLLETAINFLNNRNVEKISLIVIEKNIIAHEMYKKRGFLKENTISYWFELE